MEQLQLHATLLALFLLICSHSSPVAACFAPDRAALREVASAFPQSSPTFVGWEGDDCCSWHGVLCKSQPAANSSSSTSSGDQNARVSKLLLSHKKLEGSIPIAVCSLSALSTLDLSNNYRIYGSTPRCLGQNLTNLRVLNLGWNSLRGTIPTSFSALLQLRRLDLSGNFLEGSMLPVSGLPHLAYLDLSSNSFSSIPSFKTPRLQWLLLRGLLVGPSIPVFTNGTPILQHLDLSANVNLTSGISNVATYPLQQLQYLDLSNCFQLSGDIPVPSFISHLPHLRTLLLNSTALGAAQGPQISELLCGLKSLEVISVAATVLSGQIIPAVLPSTCKRPSLNLTSLDLSKNQGLRGPFPAWISLFSNLQVLDLSDTNLSSSAIPPEWQSLTKLISLRLPVGLHMRPTHPFFRLNWLFRLPLQTLALSSLGLTNEHIPCSQLSLLNATLQSLDLSHNLLTGGYALQCLAHHNFTALASLDLSHNALAFNLGLTIPPSLTRDLKLASCQLEGELTDQFFGMLRSIESSEGDPASGSVSLADNYFSGTLPLGIGVLSRANTLDLSHNNFTGPLPPSLGNLTYLLALHLENNHLEGDIPQELGNMSSMNFLFLGNNELKKCLYTHSQSFELEILDLSYNRLEGDLVGTFFGQDYSLLRNLLVLLLGQNRLTGGVPEALNETMAPVLSVIQLSGNRLTGTIPHTLFKQFPALTPSDSMLSAVFTDDFHQMVFTLVVKNLQLTYDYTNLTMLFHSFFAYLDLSNNMLNGSIPDSMGDLSRLRFLNLSKNHLTGNIPSSLANLSILESLDLSYNRLEGPIPMSLSKLTELAILNVSFNHGLSGSIPTNAPQFQDNTSYIGDPNLCGEPYLHACLVVAAPPQLHEEDQKTDSSESFLVKWFDEWIAIPGLCIGHMVGFLGALWVLKLTRFF